uniref:Uncharacterized protein n=1 Tax=Oryza sativa subsp. japonica TaxID=39947 RepID=Q6Z271_ORYSJ|nr:hypothetical protein [Oryza sativa Japonica Group]BAD03523.1 hypothetical protein [Oryza sativa Japonica Group]
MGDDELAGVGEKELASGGQMRAGKRRDRDKLMARGLGETEWHGTKKIRTPVAYSESSANWVPNAESSAYSVAYYENFLDEGTDRAAFYDHWQHCRWKRVTRDSTVLMRNGLHASIHGAETVDLKFTSRKIVQLKNVQPVPTINRNLAMSVEACSTFPFLISAISL